MLVVSAVHGFQVGYACFHSLVVIVTRAFIFARLGSYGLFWRVFRWSTSLKDWLWLSIFQCLPNEGSPTYTCCCHLLCFDAIRLFLQLWRGRASLQRWQSTTFHQHAHKATCHLCEALIMPTFFSRVTTQLAKIPFSDPASRAVQ